MYIGNGVGGNNYAITNEPTTTAVTDALEHALFSMDDSPVNLSTINGGNNAAINSQHNQSINIAKTTSQPTAVYSIKNIPAHATVQFDGHQLNDNHQQQQHIQIQQQPEILQQQQQQPQNSQPQLVNSVIRLNPASLHTLPGNNGILEL